MYPSLSRSISNLSLAHSTKNLLALTNAVAESPDLSDDVLQIYAAALTFSWMEEEDILMILKELKDDDT